MRGLDREFRFLSGRAFLEDLIGSPQIDLLDLGGLAFDPFGHGVIVVGVTPDVLLLQIAHAEASITSSLLLSSIICH